jgi:pimeloyl-ACP methyl ester carboxylesterase
MFLNGMRASAMLLAHMNRHRRVWDWARGLAWVWLALATSGCGTYVARRMAQAPNTYAPWLTPQARVELAFDQRVLTNFPSRFAEVGPPSARLRYRVVEPAEYDFSVSQTNWLERGKPHYLFTFDARVPGATNRWTAQPRGTVVLLHGYGVAQFAMAPWALRLAQAGWRCVLVDLRGHGRSTGRRIYYGMQEPQDVRQLLDQLERDGRLARPVAALGESYGAAVSLRLKALDPRVEKVVAIAPFAVLSNVVVNIARDYANWMPQVFPRAGVAALPGVLRVPPAELDTITELTRHPVQALFVAGAEDRISPVSEVRKLHAVAAPGSALVVVPQASHESVTYFFHGLLPPVLEWLARP